MKTSRQRIHEYINNQKAVTAADISLALGMTAANARHHLAILQEQGAIEIIGHRPRTGKGRPAQIFGPASHTSGNNLGQLASALLTEIAFLQPFESRVQSLERISKRIAPRSAGVKRHSSTHLTQRLYEVIQLLNKDNYQARWEAHIAAPRLILEHCPFKTIIDQHPELCQIDALILGSLLEETVDQLAKLTPDARGAPICIFQIGSNI